MHHRLGWVCWTRPQQGEQPCTAWSLSLSVCHSLCLCRCVSLFGRVVLECRLWPLAQLPRRVLEIFRWKQKVQDLSCLCTVEKDDHHRVTLLATFGCRWHQMWQNTWHSFDRNGLVPSGFTHSGKRNSTGTTKSLSLLKWLPESKAIHGRNKITVATNHAKGRWKNTPNCAFLPLLLTNLQVCCTERRNAVDAQFVFTITVGPDATGSQCPTTCQLTHWHQVVQTPDALETQRVGRSWLIACIIHPDCLPRIPRCCCCQTG